MTMSNQIVDLENRITELFLEEARLLKEHIDVIEEDKKNMSPEDFLALYSLRFGVDKEGVEEHLNEMKKSLAFSLEIQEKGWPEVDYSSIP